MEEGRAGQITSRNNRPLMRVSPRGKTTRDGKVAVERERRNGKQGEEERERNEEALERTQSNTEEGDGGTDGQAQFERQVFCCGQHRTHRPAMPPPSLIVNGEYNRPTGRASESAAGFGFRPGRSVSSSHFPPSLRLESAWGSSDKRRERAVTQSAASATRIHSFRGLKSV